MRKLLCIVVALFAFGSCLHHAKAADGCICTEQYQPVCGMDGKTYGNACNAACANVTVEFVGECIDPACSCLADLNDPVCGTNGRTYQNECQAGCARQQVAYKGECRTECACVMTYAPVCGADGKTYTNQCLAECSKTTVASEGACKEEDCICTADYTPVCGKDGKTYGNACGASCNGVEVDHDGECEEEGCFCIELYKPVCGANGKTYGNACNAACEKVAVQYEGECIAPAKACSCEDEPADPVCGRDGVDYRNGCEAKCAGVKVAYTRPCGGRKAACRDCQAFNNIWDPTCLLEPGQAVGSGTKSATSGTPWTYANPCYARCYGKAAPDSAFYKGSCRTDCDAKCAMAGKSPVCCGGVEYPNSCYADCLGEFDADALEKCYSGLCTGEDAIQLMSGCPEGGRMAKCSDTCSQGVPCSTDSDVECVVTSCDRFYRFRGLTICKPAWVNKTSGQLLSCN